MNNAQAMHAMCIDDLYHVERVLAKGASGITELVSIEGAGPFVRKKNRSGLVSRRAWAALPELRCPRLPHVEAAYELDDQFVVVYDYIPGQTLKEIVENRGRLPQNEAARVACQVCEALSALHECGVIHRDVSPANVIVAEDGAHLIDLGIARLRSAHATRDTTSLGTWGFAAPEQYGFAQTDARSDIYSLGKLLGYMLTGVWPDDPAYDHAVADRHCVSPEATAVITRACAFEPSARYQRVTEIVSDLGSLVADNPS